MTTFVEMFSERHKVGSRNVKCQPLGEIDIQSQEYVATAALPNYIGALQWPVAVLRPANALAHFAAAKSALALWLGAEDIMAYLPRVRHFGETYSGADG